MATEKKFSGLNVDDLNTFSKQGYEAAQKRQEANKGKTEEAPQKVGEKLFPDKQQSETLSIRISKEQLNDLDAIAAREGWSRNKVASYLIENSIKEYKKEVDPEDFKKWRESARANREAKEKAKGKQK